MPEENRLQEANSFADTAKVLRLTRAGVAWQATGCARGAYEHALAYARQRQQFGRAIGGFQLVQDLLVKMLSNVTASACLCARLSALQQADLAEDHHSALAKAFCTVRMREATGWARELLGGNGILLEPRGPVRGRFRGDLLLRGHPRDQHADRGPRHHRPGRVRLRRGRMEARSVIEVVEYDEAWPVRAAAARADLISLGVFDAVEHIGSTSVPGLAAKPVVDLMAAAASLDAVAAAGHALAGLGYHAFDPGMDGRLFYFLDEAGQRAYQLHVVPADTWEARNERLLRDHLRAHPEDARRYAELKQRLAAEHTDGTEYTRAKTELIQELTDRARADRGLAPVPGLGRMSYRADQPPSSGYEEPLANDAGAEQR